MEKKITTHDNAKKKFTYIDLFAGIGGFHLAMDSLGGSCVFASEIDEFARSTYIANFQETSSELFSSNMFNKDIREVSPLDIPDFDVLCAGFPCQPFSQAGLKHGFNDTIKSERGNLFFYIAEIIEKKQPSAYFLENVQGLLNHDNGNTFKVIKNILQNELGYSLYYKIVKAQDYGLPQLRPRIFMIGFKNEDILSNFSFPPTLPLKFTMSDVWNGKCSREIGFTLRVGGRGSPITDRRNWDSYLVDGEVRRISSTEAKKMQGFPDEFKLPVSETQAMKLLGNSVAVDAVRECGKSLVKHLLYLKKNTENNMSSTKNKGEWTELYSFIKLINDKKLFLADKYLNLKSTSDFFTVSKVTTLNMAEECYLSPTDKVLVKNKVTGEEKEVEVSSFINNESIRTLLSAITHGSGTFAIPEFDCIETSLGLSLKKGGNSTQKSDIVLDISSQGHQIHHQGFGIKSYIGSKPTLLNASGNTNFVFEVDGLQNTHVLEVNAIDTRTKLTDRINKILSLGGSFKFAKVEKSTLDYNLTMVDSIMPTLLAEMLLEFYINRSSKLSENLDNIIEKNLFNQDKKTLTVKVKRFLLCVLLGFFSGSKWDGTFISNGLIVVKENGEQIGYHIIDKDTLEDYLFENIKFDTPSTTRHCYGSLILEKNGKLYFKFNLQLRF